GSDPTVTVTAANSAPTDIALSNSSVAENAGANAAVGNLSTTDVDARSEERRVGKGCIGRRGNGSFNISGASLRATASFNFEATPSLSVRVRSTDAGGLNTEKVFTITVTNVNEAPTDIALSNSSVAENAGANAAVGNLSTTDVDAGDTFTYTLVSGLGDTGNGSFNISGASLRATASLNFEATPSLSVRVRSTDAGGLNTEKVFTITVTNVNEAPVITEGDSTTVNMSEDSSPTPFSLALHATDPDVGDILTWSISTPASHGTATASGTGLSKAIGYTPNANYNGTDSFIVQVSDGNGLTDTITVNV